MKEGIQFISKKHGNIVIHTLKCVEPYFTQVEKGKKKFEIRKDDREFKYTAGDCLSLYQVENGEVTGKWHFMEITFVLRDAPQYGLMDGYVILSLK